MSNPIGVAYALKRRNSRASQGTPVALDDSDDKPASKYAVDTSAIVKAILAKKLAPVAEEPDELEEEPLAMEDELIEEAPEKDILGGIMAKYRKTKK